MTPRKAALRGGLLIAGSLVAILGAASVAAEPAIRPSKSTADQLEQISAVVRRQIEAGLIPGAIVYIAERGKPAYFAAQGFADLEARKPVSSDTIFRLYSMTKPLTCAAVMTLYDEGLIGLDDPVKSYLPEFSRMTVRTPSGIVEANRDLTIRDLLTHTSGLSYEVTNSAVSADYRDADVFAIRNRQAESLESHVKRLARLPLASQPGAAWTYGESMGVLGRVVEVVSGETFRTYLKRRVLEPLDMRDTDFFVPRENAGRLMQLYTKSPTTALAKAQDLAQYGGSYLMPPMLEYGGAGLVGTTEDYMKFAQMLLDKGSHGGRRILSSKSVRLMTTNALPEALGDQPLAASGRAPGVGFGFCGLVVARRSGESPPGNVGEYAWGGWASTNFWIDPKRDLAGLVMTQVIPDVPGSGTLYDEVRQVVYGTAPQR
jgi:CubicO group peptidase (beta-lactamase class C family)